jgi:putative ABC transport system permease protein
LGSNILRVIPGKFGVGSNSSFGSIRFDERDLQRLSRIREADAVIPVYTKSVTVTGGKKSEVFELYSSSEGIFLVVNVTPMEGRLFTKEDVDKRSKVAVIGPKIAKELFGSEREGVGRSIKAGGHNFKVIGIHEPKGGGSFGGPDLDTNVYIPYKTGFVFNTDKTFAAIMVQAANENEIKIVKEKIEETLLKRYEKDDFSIVEQTEILNTISSIFGVMNSVLIAIAAISRIVGGIGIMNIMYVTVTERIKEIGIRRAIGARKKDILVQFLVTSILLSLMGGLLGLGLSFIIVFFIQRFFPAYIDVQSVVLALGVSTTIGIVFGVFPAKKAADLSPIEAIRYE